MREKLENNVISIIQTTNKSHSEAKCIRFYEQKFIVLGNPTCKTSLEKSCKDLIKNFGPETVLLEKNCQDYCGHMFNMTLSRNFDKDYSFSNEIKNEN